MGTSTSHFCPALSGCFFYSSKKLHVLSSRLTTGSGLGIPGTRTDSRRDGTLKTCHPVNTDTLTAEKLSGFFPHPVPEHPSAGFFIFLCHHLTF